jgi:CRP/FNR family transcriptional regulator, cyclic AMP receptor protein
MEDSVMTKIDLFRNATDVVSFPAGAVIFKEGEPGETMYVVKDGAIDVFIHDKLIDTVEPGSIVGEMAIIDSGPRSATAVARTLCQLVPIDQKRFSFLVQGTPYFAIQVMQIMANRLRRTNALV